jgi:hypothetical protein
LSGQMRLPRGAYPFANPGSLSRYTAACSETTVSLVPSRLRTRNRSVGLSSDQVHW